MTETWADRTILAIVADRSTGREEALVRTFADNGLDLIIGQSVADFGGLRSVLSITTPDEWLGVSELIDSLLEREPLSKGPHYSGERLLLGMLSAELKGYAAAAERRHAA